MISLILVLLLLSFITPKPKSKLKVPIHTQAITYIEEGIPVIKTLCTFKDKEGNLYIELLNLTQLEKQKEK
jgi:hypothetical protein